MIRDTPQPRSLPALEAVIVVALLCPLPAAGQIAAPARTGTDLFVLDPAGTPLGEFPANIKLLKGTMEVVLKDGAPMIKASSVSEFLITLPQALPQDFTLEFELVPKACCNPQDLSFEGTPTINQGMGSAHILWDSDGYLAVIGGASDNYETPMPEELRTSLPGALTSVVAVFEGTTIRLYTNGRRLYTMTDRQFARGRTLRVHLGGQDDGANAVHLARLRVLAGALPPTVIAQGATPPPGQPVAASPPPQPAPPTGGAGPPGTSTGSPLPPAGAPSTTSQSNSTSGVTAVTTTTPTTGTATPAAAPQPTIGPTSPSRTAGVTRTGATTTLAPPTSLTVTGTPAMAMLTWQAPVGWTPTGYTVVRNTTGTSESVLLTTSPLTTTRYDDRSGFAAGKAYTYVVTAQSTNPTAFGTAETPFLPPPPQNVANVVATTRGNDVVLPWTGVAYATRYLIVGSSQAMAREVPSSQTEITYSGVAPGTYTWSVGARYDPGPIETPASTWPSVTLELFAPRIMTIVGFSSAGGFTTLPPRTITFTGFTAAGGVISPPPRTITLSGFRAAGGVSTAPPIVTLPGFSAAGDFSSISRTLTLSGFAAAGFTPVTVFAPRTIVMPGWVAVGGRLPIP